MFKRLCQLTQPFLNSHSFLAVQDSSIGDLVTHSLTHSVTHHLILASSECSAVQCRAIPDICHMRMWGDLPNQGQLSWDSTSYHKRRKQWSSKKHLFNDYKAQITMVSWLKQQLRRTDSRGQPGLQVGRRRTFWQSDKTQRRSRCTQTPQTVSV